MNVALSLVIGILCGALIIYLVMRPKLKQTQQLNEETQRENTEIEFNNKELQKELSQLTARREEIADSIMRLKEQAEHSAKDFYDKNMELAAEQLDRSLERAAADYQQKEQDYQSQLLDMQVEFSQDFQEQLETRIAELAALDEKLERMRSLVEAGVEASKRAAEMEEQQDFYRLVLSEDDINEIEKLRDVLPYLRDKEPLNKVIYKVYYEKPYTDMVGRVVGTATKTGIYKITNLENGMCYVGQAANIAERWRQHIKRGVGAETPTRNKLYPIMYKIGPENFTFEIVEECSRAELDEREDYWQDYFKAKEFGYSIK